MLNLTSAIRVFDAGGILRKAPDLPRLDTGMKQHYRLQRRRRLHLADIDTTP